MITSVGVSLLGNLLETLQEILVLPNVCCSLSSSFSFSYPFAKNTASLTTGGALRRLDGWINYIIISLAIPFEETKLYYIEIKSIPCASACAQDLMCLCPSVVRTEFIWVSTEAISCLFCFSACSPNSSHPIPRLETFFKITYLKVKLRSAFLGYLL